MATLGASMVTLLTDNWAGAGAAPTFGFLIDDPADLTPTTEQVIVRLPIHEDVDPINDNLSNFKFTMQIRVKTTVSEARLKVLTDETIRIINAYAITGITRQFAKRGENTSDRKRQVFSYDVWANLEEHASTAGTAYSSPGAGDVDFPADVSLVGDLTITGGDILTPASLNFKVSGDTSDYFVFGTSGNQPKMSAISADVWIDDNLAVTGTLGVTGVTTLGDVLRVDDGVGVGLAATANRPLNITRAGVQQIFLRSTDEAATLIIRGFTGKDAGCLFYEEAAARGIFYYDASVNKLKFYSYGSTEDFYLTDAGGAGYSGDFTVGNDILTDGDKTADIGATGVAWDNVYADDFVNESPFLEIERPLAAIKAITTKDGKLDYKSLPDWIRTFVRDRSQDKRHTEVVDKGTPEERIITIVDEVGPKSIVAERGYSMNRMIILLYQALQEATARIEALEAR